MKNLAHRIEAGHWPDLVEYGNGLKTCIRCIDKGYPVRNPVRQRTLQTRAIPV